VQSTIKTESMDRDYYNHVHVMSRMRDIKTTEVRLVSAYCEVFSGERGI